MIIAIFKYGSSMTLTYTALNIFSTSVRNMLQQKNNCNNLQIVMKTVYYIPQHKPQRPKERD